MYKGTHIGGESKTGHYRRQGSVLLLITKSISRFFFIPMPSEPGE